MPLATRGPGPLAGADNQRIPERDIMNQRLTFERLEERILMAVTVVRNSAGELGLRGDSANDVVDIDGTGGLGGIQVFVNGVSVGTYTGITNIKGSLGAGNDFVNLHAV